MTAPPATCWLCDAELAPGATAGRKFCSNGCRQWVQGRRDAYRQRMGLSPPTPAGLGAQARPRGEWYGCLVCVAQLSHRQERTCSRAHRQTWYRWRRRYREEGSEPQGRQER